MKRLHYTYILIFSVMIALFTGIPSAKAAAPPAWAVLYADYLRSITQPLVPQTVPTPEPAPQPTISADVSPDATGPISAAQALTAIETPVPSPTPTPVPSPAQDHYIRCFLRLADLDRNGVPELLHGYRTADDPEIRVQVLGIVDNRVVKATGNVIHAAYSLKMTKLTLFQTRQGFFWMFESGGHEKLNGRRQYRRTQLTYRNGNIKSANRFTKRWTSEKNEYYTDGEVVSSVTYKNRYKVYRSNIKAVEVMPEAALGNSTQIPTQKKILDSFETLVRSYQKIALPAKMKLKGKSAKFQLGARDKARLVIASRYASATRGPVTWSSSDPMVLTVNSKGVVEAVGYGSATIYATLSNGMHAKAKLTVVRPKVKSLKVSAVTSKMRDGEQLQLFCTLSPMTSRADLIWKSSNPSVATVDPKTGLVTARNPGKVRIGCWVNKKIRNGYDITVRNGSWIQSVTLSAPEDEIRVGERLSIGYTFAPEGASRQKLNWSSSNPNVADVSPGGVVTGMSPGKATIIASTALNVARGRIELSVTADEGLGTASAHGGPVANGVYQISLQTQGKRTLSVRGFSALQRLPLALSADTGDANSRFILRNTREDLYEIRPLCAPMMYLCLHEDPLDNQKGERLALALMPTEGERLFRLHRLANGGYMFSLAADRTVSFSAAHDEDGATVFAGAFDPTDTLQRYRLTLLSEPDKLIARQIQGPVPQEAGGIPVPIAEEELDWVRNLQNFLQANKDDVNLWTHVQLCDMDFSGVPELIIFSGKRVQPVSTSLTAMTGYIYSPELGDIAPAVFEYEPAPNTSLRDALPTMRLLIDGRTRQRQWILTDGTTGNNKGSMRWIQIHYSAGTATQEPLFVRAWRPRNKEGKLYETFYHLGVECSKYTYEREYQKHFRGSIWGNSVQVLIETQTRLLPEIVEALTTLVQGRRWYA